MASISFPTPAASRCSEEIWLLIFRFATVIYWNDFETPFECSTLGPVYLYGLRVFGHNTSSMVIDPLEQHLEDCQLSMVAKRNLTQVCRLWRRIALPFLVERIEVGTPRALGRWLALLGPRNTVDPRGPLVRVLKIRPSMFMARDSLKWGKQISHALEICDALREFSCEDAFTPAHVVSDLIGNCSQTLTTLNLRDHEISLDDIVILLQSCPYLKSFHFAGPRRESISSEVVRIAAGLQHACLQSLFWDVVDMKSGFPDFLAAVKLPELSRLSIYMTGMGSDDDDDEGILLNIDGRTVFGYLKPIFTTHGEQIRWLSVDEHYHDGESMDIGWFVRLCPRLEEMHFDLCTSQFYADPIPHSHLRTVVLQTFFCSRFDPPDELKLHCDRVRTTVANVCASFPSLKTIRCRDIEPITSHKSELERSKGGYPREYVDIVEGLITLCARGGIDFMNALGEAVELDDFAPPVEYWDSDEDE